MLAGQGHSVSSAYGSSPAAAASYNPWGQPAPSPTAAYSTQAYYGAAPAAAYSPYGAPVQGYDPSAAYYGAPAATAVYGGGGYVDPSECMLFHLCLPH